MKNRTTRLLIFLCLTSFSCLTAEEIDSIGSLYIVNELEKEPSQFKLNASYGYEISHSLLNVHETQLSFAYLLSRYWAVGLSGSRQFYHEKNEDPQVTKKIRKGGFVKTNLIPDSTWALFTEIRPLSGLLNLFNSATWPMELWLQIGGGQASYRNYTKTFSLAHWNAQVESFFTRHWGASFSLGQEIEAPFSHDSLTKTKLRLGCSFKF